MDEDSVSPRSFFGVYILINVNPLYKGRIYIGFTSNPARRIRQHNREIKGGARQTGRSRGPWAMVLIVHGFPTRLAALQFEWAWQQPQLSKRLKNVAGKQKKPQESCFEFRFRILCEMLNVGPWKRLPLVVRWLKQEYKLEFPSQKQPPLHMSVAYGPVVMQKLKGKCNNQEDETSNFSKGGLQQVSTCAAIGLTKNSILCYFCGKEQASNTCNRILSCIVESCTLTAHLMCLANNFLQQHGQADKFLLPISGVCAVCGMDLLWKDLVQQGTCGNDDHGCGTDSSSDGLSGSCSGSPLSPQDLDIEG